MKIILLVGLLLAMPLLALLAMSPWFKSMFDDGDKE